MGLTDPSSEGAAPPPGPVVLAEIAHRVLACRGETRSGDGAYVRREGEHTLFAVIDSLGHGEKAAAATDLALAYLQAVAFVKRDVGDLVRELGDALRGSRGAAALVCIWDGATLSCCGVGNVELRSVGARVSVQLTPGVLGSPLRKLHTFAARIDAETTVFLHSDGISSRIPFAALAAATPDSLGLCDAALAAGRREHDDATVLVARFKERPR